MSPKPQKSTWWTSLASFGIGGITDVFRIFAESFKGPPPPPPGLVVLLALSAFGSILGLALAIFLGIRGSTAGAITLGLAAFALILVAMVGVVFLVIIHLRADRGTDLPHDPKPQPVWSRLVPRRPIDGDTMNRLKEDLDRICEKAHRHVSLSLRDQDFEEGAVRANIFLPDTDGLGVDGVCELAIYKTLRCHMDARDDKDAARATGECNIRFWPNQGLTGVTFIKQGEPTVALAKRVRKRYVWEAKYHLTDVQKDVFHPDLNWIVSFPLTRPDGGVQRAMGVLNVDGVKPLTGDEEEDEKILLNLVSKIFGDVVALSARLATVKQARISVFLQEISDV